jgi:hypothetical protein
VGFRGAQLHRPDQLSFGLSLLLLGLAALRPVGYPFHPVALGLHIITHPFLYNHLTNHIIVFTRRETLPILLLATMMNGGTGCSCCFTMASNVCTWVAAVK